MRALRLLKELPTLLCEDTRTTRMLLQHYNLNNNLVSFHMHNEHAMTPRLVEQLKSGAEMGVVSDAGTPGISDAAFLLVRACVQEGIKVECLPGATALIPALISSGLPCDRFVFEGFLPTKKGRQSRLKEILEDERTVVLYESPHRLARLLEELKTLGAGARSISVAREISKKFEEHVRGTVEEVGLHFNTHEPRGECVVTLAGNTKHA
jgi:16S rRNA (cytidine1402-2'-O)-methyltransferase